MYGVGTGKLYVDVKANGGWIRLDSIVGHQHIGGSDARSFRTSNLDQFAGDVVRIRFTSH
jgi:hypothetical protein